MTKRRTEEEIREIIEGFGYKYISSYNTKESHQRRVVIEDDIGYKYDVIINSLINNHIPDFVCKGNMYSLYNINLWIVNENKNFTLLKNNKYGGNFEKLTLHCSICENNFKTNWHDLYSGIGCPVCAGKIILEERSLNSLFPSVSSEWHYDLNIISPSEVLPSSKKKFYWICSKCGYGKNGEWITSVGNRTDKKSNCPSCSGRVVSDKNRLSILYPEIAAEWHPTKNVKLTPKDVSYGSTKSAWWLCGVCGYEWETQIQNRASKFRGCPSCNFSKGENKVYSFLTSRNIEFEIQHFFVNCKYKESLPFDFYIEKYNLAIEYDGEQHFFPVDFAGRGKEWAKKELKKTKKRDKIKTKYCKDNNINLLRIPYREFDNIENILEKTLSEF